MSQVIKAVYHRGVFEPSNPVVLSEGTEVEVTLPEAPATSSIDSPAAILKRIAALPLAASTDDFSGEAHDREIYR